MTSRVGWALELELPIAAGDFGFAAYGVAPFGYHVGDHRFDGHPGLDFEFLPGRKVRSAHAGTLRHHPDSRDPALRTVTIEFRENGVDYRMYYSNIAALEPGIDNGSSVAAGQAFGTPASLTMTMYGRPVTFAMTHFQFNDSRVNYGLTNSAALAPTPYFSAAARSTLASVWQQSQYDQMVCEPFMTTSRGMTPYPLVKRVWQLITGTLAHAIEFSCNYASAASNYIGYRLLDAQMSAIEAGTVSLTPVIGGNSTIDFTSTDGALRKGLIRVKDGSMDLAYGTVGATRPNDMTYATRYASRSASRCTQASDAICIFGDESPYRVGETVTIGLEVDTSKQIRAGGADLWIAIQLPDTSILYLHPDLQWRSAAQAHRAQISGSVRMTFLDALVVPPELTRGTYTVYAALNPAGQAPNLNALLSNLASAPLYLLPD